MPTRNSALVFLLILCASILSAQNPRGSLRGTVQDPSGARIPGAKIVLRSHGSAIERAASSEDRGEFRLDDLLPCDYRVTVSGEGFAPAEADVTIAVSSVREVTVTLKAAAASQTVNVQGQGSSITTQPIDLASVVHQGVITRQDLQTLPLAHRSFANIAFLAPGTEPVEPSDPTKARITAVATGGSSGLNNEISVDGGDNSDDFIGGFLQNFSPDVIQEFAMRTANEDADTGGTTAGSVVITTRRGTNDWHGDESFYDRAAALNARYPIENPAPDPKQPFSRQNYVFTLGGPVKKDKVWVFSSFEYVHENASIAYSPSSQDEFSALATLASDGLIPGIDSIAVPKNTPVPFRDYLGSLRFDWAQSAKSQWFWRGSVDNYTTHNNLVQQGTLPSTGLLTHNNYMNMVVSNSYAFSPSWLGTFVFNAGGLHLTQTRNSNLGFALKFPFSATSQTISGFETFGDNQFDTAITAFPSVRNQEKYQFRYDVSHVTGDHSFKFGVNFIHEPVLGGAFAATAEQFIQYPFDPTVYAADPAQFYFTPPSSECTPAPDPASEISCTFTPAGDGRFSQNVQRMALYAQDSWRITPHFTVDYGLRYQTTWGLFIASGRSQMDNPALALAGSLVNGIPHDDRKQFAPRLGVTYSPGDSGRTVIRAGFGLFFNDLAQGGWAEAFQAVNGSGSGPSSLIDPNYKTPYALHASAGVQHAINANWMVSADYTHEQGNHGYRRYDYPDVSIFRSDNRSSYDSLALVLQGNVSHRVNLIAHYTLSTAKTWGCLLGELFDYVNGVCDPFNAFAPGDYGPSGEDIRHRFVLGGTLHVPGGVEVSTLTQAESARPFTLTTPVGDRAVVNGVKTSLDDVRGTPYIQVDLRVSRPIHFRDRWSITPFAELFNLFNRNNPGANYVTDISALPTPVNDLSNATALCPDPSCSVPITSLKQLLVPAGGLGDFFGPGTTVGIPFAAQLGVRVSF